MPATLNPFVPAGEWLLEQAKRSASGRGLDTLFTGPVADLSKRWGASAVEDMTGNWHIVRLEGHIQDAQPRRLKLFTGGAFGRGFRVQSLFEPNRATRPG